MNNNTYRSAKFEFIFYFTMRMYTTKKSLKIPKG